jgi:hypothetical protein
VEAQPYFTGLYRSCQGIVKWIKTHHSKSRSNFMEVFVKTVADSSACSPLLACNF